MTPFETGEVPSLRHPRLTKADNLRHKYSRWFLLPQLKLHMARIGSAVWCFLLWVCIIIRCHSFPSLCTKGWWTVLRLSITKNTSLLWRANSHIITAFTWCIMHCTYVHYIFYPFYRMHSPCWCTCSTTQTNILTHCSGGLWKDAIFNLIIFFSE